MPSSRLFGSALLSAVALFVQSSSATPIIVYPGGPEHLEVTADNSLNGTTPAGQKYAPKLDATTSLTFGLTNWLDSTDVWAYIYGLDGTNQFAFGNPADPTSFFYPQTNADGSNTLIPNSAIGFQFGGYNQTIQATIPGYLNGGRIYISQGQMQLFANTNPANGAQGIVTPAPNNPGDPNNNVSYAFMEFAWNDVNLVIDISAVDLVGVPIGLDIQDASGGPNSVVQGMKSTAVNDVCNGLIAQSAADGSDWKAGCVYLEGETTPIRAISPKQLVAGGNVNNYFNGYFDAYIQQVLDAYTSTPLYVNDGSGNFISCQTASGNLNCDGAGHAYGPPSLTDIFACPGGSGAFEIAGGNDAVVAPHLCAAWNRGTLLLPEASNYTSDGMTCAGAVQPCLPPSYYFPASGAVYNQWNRIVHENEWENVGYSFAYDDNVSPNGPAPFYGAVSGVITMDTPGVAGINVGGYDLAPNAGSTS